jgi:hypothetical protein
VQSLQNKVRSSIGIPHTGPDNPEPAHFIRKLKPSSHPEEARSLQGLLQHDPIPILKNIQRHEAPGKEVNSRENHHAHFLGHLQQIFRALDHTTVTPGLRARM